MSASDVSQVTPPRNEAVSRATSKNRLAGLDAMRGFAAFGVVCIHATGLTKPPSAFGEAAASFFRFAVPFFLLASFYFLTLSLTKNSHDLALTLKKRLGRLLPPYIVWGVFYLLLRAGLYIIKKQPDKLHDLLTPPVGLIIYGASAVHLYFLPLVMVGQSLLVALFGFIKKMPNPLLIALFLMAAGVRLALELSGNLFNLTTGLSLGNFYRSVGVDPGFWLWRVLGCLVSFALTCLPLILIGAWLARVLPKFQPSNSTRMAIVVGAILAGVTVRFLPLFPQYETLALAGFVSAYFLPLRSTRFIELCGAYSFGIYLVHQVVLEAIDFVAARLPIASAGGATAIFIGGSVITFALSFLIIHLAATRLPRLKVPLGVA